MISIAVLASSPMAQARLEALVAAHSGWRLSSRPRPAAHMANDRTAGDVDADVLLVDPGARRAETVLRTFSRAPRLPPIVLLAGDPVPRDSSRLLRAGVHAILPGDASPTEIAACIEAVAAGLIVLHPSALPAAATKAASAHRARGESRTVPLTPRELEVLGMMAEGMGNRAIAQHLGISSHTVKFHIAAVLDKLNVRGRTEAVTAGMRLGLLMV